MILPLLAIGAVAVAFSGCGGATNESPASTQDSTAQTSTPPAATTTRQATTGTTTPARKVKLFFADADAQQLIGESRPTTATGSDLRAALVELAKGPASGSTRQPVLPMGTTIIGTNVRGGEALVNLSGEFNRGYPPGGAAAEFAVLAPLVYTATAIDGVERVRITVDGRTPAPAGSQYDWTRAFTRADFPDVLAAP
jgi:spore germination protein GerM